MNRRKVVAGNWKMHGAKGSLEHIANVASLVGALPGDLEVVLFPPATILALAAEACSSGRLKLGGQDCSAEPSGAFTGEIAAVMLKDVGADYVLLGHSERRSRHGESDHAVRQKAIQAMDAGMTVVICIGETRQERDQGRTLEVLSLQLEQSVPRVFPPDRLIVAYEPIWAIGTGLTPTTVEIESAHGHLRSELVAQWGDGGTGIAILYGGSVGPANAEEILALTDVDGVLVGAACLDPQKFETILKHAASATRRLAA
jgi:triosephosphate isomerase